MRAAVSSGVQQGGGRRREEVAGGAGRGRGTAEGGLESVGEEGEAMGGERKERVFRLGCGGGLVDHVKVRLNK